MSFDRLQGTGGRVDLAGRRRRARSWRTARSAPRPSPPARSSSCSSAYILWKIGVQALPAIAAITAWAFSQRRPGIPARRRASASSPRSGARSTARSSRSIIAGFFGVGVAIFLTQDFLDARLARVFRTVIEMLAAIPSVVYGLWGIYVVIPALRPVADFLHGALRLVPAVLDLARRPRHGAGGDRARDHGAADGGGDQPGRLLADPLQGQGSRLRHGHHQVGGDHEGDAADRDQRHLRLRWCSASAARSARRWRSRC